MYKKTVLFLLILGFILIFSSNFTFAMELEGEMNSIFIKNGESEIKPIIEGKLHLKPEFIGFGLGFNAQFSDQYFSIYDIFSVINLDLNEKYETNLSIGLSQYNGFVMKEEYRGFLLGSNIEKKYNKNTTFFTNLNFSFFPNESLTRLKSGIKYKFSNNMRLNISYNDFSNKNNGFTFGLGFILGK